MQKLSTRAISFYYIFALSIIAVLSIASHFTIERTISTNHNSAELINISGKQRMLSQRITGMAAQYELGDIEAIKLMQSATNEFEDNHRLLLKLSTNATNDDKLNQLYFDGENSLDEKVDHFISSARQYIQNADNTAARKKLFTQLTGQANQSLLTSLDNAVLLRQHDSETRQKQLSDLQWAILTIILITLFLEALTIFRPMIHKISKYTNEMLKLATTDSLTGILNRTSFIDQSKEVIAHCKEQDQPAFLLMLDLDHFKKINDSYGHSIGDKVLKTFTQTIKKKLRPQDILGRLGGEEFAIVLPSTSPEEAAIIANRLCKSVEEINTKPAGCLSPITVSIGLTPIDSSIDIALIHADKALYKAKETRNKVVSETTPAF